MTETANGGSVQPAVGSGDEIAFVRRSVAVTGELTPQLSLIAASGADGTGETVLTSGISLNEQLDCARIPLIPAALRWPEGR
jgi:hypothetical protein